jgi:hypothetical protein
MNADEAMPVLKIGVALKALVGVCVVCARMLALVSEVDVLLA